MSDTPRITIKRAYLPASEEDGTRILVDRLWPRGIAKDKLGAIWMKDAAPSTALRKWLHADESRWDDFVPRYRAELDAAPDALTPLLAEAERGPVTLIYGARSETQNHAIVLRDYLLEKLGSKSPPPAPAKRKAAARARKSGD